MLSPSSLCNQRRPLTKARQKMAQSVRRQETPGAMDHESQRDKTRTGYFGNVKTRLGSKLPPGVSQPPQFAKRPWETPPGVQRPRHAAESRPLDHTPHIRNPKLRQYYLQGTPWDLNNTAVKQEHSSGPSGDSTSSRDVEAVPMPDGQLCLLALPPECCQGEGPGSMRYLKLFCRYITDRKGVVSGILLVTSNKIFFDPCKTHALVKEHGCEEYLLSCSVDSLASVAFFSDISHVRFNTSQQRKKGKKNVQNLNTAKRPAGGFPNPKGESLPARVSVASSDLSHLALCRTKEVCGEKEKEAESVDVSAAEVELDSGPPEVLPEASAGDLGASAPSGAATSSFGDREAETSSGKSWTAVPWSSSAGNAGGLMFLRLRVQPSVGKTKGAGGLQMGASKPIHRKDAWLALSQESSNELCAYLTHCRPDLCILEGGEDEREADRDEEEFVVIEDEEEEEDAEVFQRHRGSGDDWEMVLMEESGDKPGLVIDREPDGLNDIVQSSRILEASHVRELCKELPARTVGYSWQLTYSTSRHGASLKSLYRRLGATDSPVLVVIKDALDETFGAFLSHPLRLSETFYGTGETFLFMLHPRFKCFKWTGDNSFFIKGDLDSFAIGGGSGHFGLWVDENLYLGRSNPCYTFNNCCLSETNDFRVMELEVWTFT
uniref:Si:ch211-15d5.11 n=1 Tax=Gasterosteus aculeatus aculeatus TaxID=481459 RepID=A0AAQ4PE13_GASAC